MLKVQHRTSIQTSDDVQALIFRAILTSNGRGTEEIRLSRALVGYAARRTRRVPIVSALLQAERRTARILFR